jgi:hemerythrin
MPLAVASSALFDVKSDQWVTVGGVLYIQGDKVMDIVWTTGLETGNTIIDNQHYQWIYAVNALHHACKRGKGLQEVENTLKFLDDYTIAHFAGEEALQEKYRYPDYLYHKRIHTEFKGVVQNMAQKLSIHGPKPEFTSEVYVNIAEWVVNHIKGEDFKVAAYIQSSR